MPALLRTFLALALLVLAAGPAAAQSYSPTEGRLCATPAPTEAQMSQTTAAVQQWLATHNYEAGGDSLVTIPSPST